MEPGQNSEKRHRHEERFREIEEDIGPLCIDHSNEWLRRLEERTKGDLDLRCQYLNWMRTHKPKRQIHVQPFHQWLDQVGRADFCDPLLALELRRSLFSREVDYLELAIDEDLNEILIVLSDPGALPIYRHPVTELPETLIADEGLQMHPAFLSLSVLGCHSTDPEVHIPKLVLPFGRLVSVKTASFIGVQHQSMQGPELWDQVIGNGSEELRRKFWKQVKESNIMKDTDYFVVVDVVTPGYPVWIIYNPDQEEDSEDLTIPDLLGGKFPQLDSKSGFGAAQIFPGVQNWQSSPSGPSPDPRRNPLL